MVDITVNEVGLHPIIRTKGGLIMKVFSATWHNNTLQYLHCFRIVPSAVMQSVITPDEVGDWVTYKPTKKPKEETSECLAEKKSQ